MTDFDKTTELKMKLDPLIATARVDLDALTRLDKANGDELWNRDDETADVGRKRTR